MGSIPPPINLFPGWAGFCKSTLIPPCEKLQTCLLRICLKGVPYFLPPCRGAFGRIFPELPLQKTLPQKTRKTLGPGRVCGKLPPAPQKEWPNGRIEDAVGGGGVSPSLPHPCTRNPKSIFREGVGGPLLERERSSLSPTHKDCRLSLIWGVSICTPESRGTPPPIWAWEGGRRLSAPLNGEGRPPPPEQSALCPLASTLLRARPPGCREKGGWVGGWTAIAPAPRLTCTCMKDPR